MSKKGKRKSELYLKYLERIKEAYQKAESWEDVVTSDYFNSDEGESMEAFIDFVEEVYKTEVKDAKELEKLTGLTALLPKEQNIEKGKEPTLDDILTSSRYNRYFKALENTLREGGTYEDLLKIEPKEYKLPESWGVVLGKNKQEAILWALSFEFLINEPASLMLLPDLRSIAQEIQAPYSVLMDAYNITRIARKKTIREVIDLYKQKLRDKFPTLVKAKSKKWREEWLLENEPKLKDDAYNDIREEYAIELSRLALNELRGEAGELEDEIAKDINSFFKNELTGLVSELRNIL